jgi:hypothetical protein
LAGLDENPSPQLRATAKPTWQRPEPDRDHGADNAAVAADDDLVAGLDVLTGA